MVRQARNQFEAINGNGVLEWFFKDETVADMFRRAMRTESFQVSVYVVP
jgi:hypothetical protein